MLKFVNNRFLKFSQDNLVKIKRCLNTEGTHMKTDVQLLTRNDESNYLYIHAYSALGFTLSSETRVWGPIALFPKTVLHWNVKGPEYINAASLCLFPLLVPKLDIVVIGYGDRNNKVNNDVYRYLKSHNINAEILPTETACATFNFLNLERRYVAAGLIPVANDIRISPEDDDQIVVQFDDIESDIQIDFEAGKGKTLVDAGKEMLRLASYDFDKRKHENKLSEDEKIKDKDKKS